MDHEDVLTLIAAHTAFYNITELIRIDSRGLEYRRVHDFHRKRRLIPLVEIECVFPYSVRVRDHYGYHDEYGLMIETLGYPLRVGPGRDLEAVERLQERIERSNPRNHSGLGQRILVCRT